MTKLRNEIYDENGFVEVEFIEVEELKSLRGE